MWSLGMHEHEYSLHVTRPQAVAATGGEEVPSTTWRSSEGT